jgi:hypothetical protein
LHVTDFDADAAPRAFQEDVAALRGRGFRLQVFSTHGGQASPDGMTNSALDYPELTGTDLRWVATRFSVRFDNYFSDGGSGAQPAVERTRLLRDFIAAMRPGGRYRILVHAQYYRPFPAGDEPCILPPWPVRPAHRHALFGRAGSQGSSGARLMSSRPRAAAWTVLAKALARRLFGGTKVYRTLAELRAARARALKLEKTVLAREAEVVRLRALVEATSAKNRELYARNVRYAERLRKERAEASSTEAADRDA